MFDAYYFFILSLVISWLLIRYVPQIKKSMLFFANALESKAFPAQTTHEYNKFALLRIMFGLVIFVRGVNVYGFLLESERYSAVGLWAGAELIAGALLVLGLFSQWALIFLVGGMWQYGDLVVGKSTLGNDIGAILAVFLLLVNSGKYLSVDSGLLSFASKSRWALLYYDGLPSRESILLVKFSAIASYWAVCIYSISMHLNEPAWMDGSAGPLLFTNNFMSAWSNYFSYLFESSELAVYLAKCGLWMMMLWYPLVLPFVLLGGIFRKYIIIWGWLFFALSLFGLKLGYLAEIEVLLWLALFWSFVGLDQKGRLEVIYDDRCNLCDRTVQIVTLLDIFGQIKLRPLSQNMALLADLGIEMDQALKDLYGVSSSDRGIFYGYDFYIQLARKLVLLWPLFPVLFIGKVLLIGPAIYRFIAARRMRLFGVCELPRKKFLPQKGAKISQSITVQSVALHMFVLILLYLAAVPAPYIGWAGVSSVGAQAAHIYGVTPINVFNKTDLRMAENWFVLRSINFDEPVPVFAEDGSRLLMHKSDRIYFGHTLSFRRSVIGINSCQFDQWQSMFEYLSLIYLQQRHVASGSYAFTYKQFYQPLVNSVDLAKNHFSPVPPATLCELTYTVAYVK